MKKYYTVVSKTYPRLHFNEKTNHVDTEEIELSKKIEISKYVKSSMIFNLSIIAIWGISLAVFITLWALLWVKSNPDLLMIPIGLIITGAGLLVNTISNIQNTKKGYIDDCDFNYENLDQFLKEEIEELNDQNSLEMQIAEEWRKNHPLEEDCRKLIELGDSTVLASFIRALKK